MPINKNFVAHPTQAAALVMGISQYDPAYNCLSYSII
jgi:hypothetical protein